MKEFIDDDLIMPLRSLRRRAGEEYIYNEIYYCGEKSPLHGPGDSKISYLNDMDDSIRQAMEDGTTGFMIVTGNKNIARKAAVYINDKLTVRENNICDIFGSDVPPEIAGKLSDSLKETNDVFYEMEEITFMVPFFDTNLPVTQRDSSELILLDTPEFMEEKIDAIRSYRGMYRYIWITPELRDDPMICNLKMTDRYCEIVIPDPTDTYYSELFDKLLMITGGRLEEGLPSIDVVSRLRQKCGNSFEEESLDGVMQSAIRRALRRGEKGNTLIFDDLFPNESQKMSAKEELDSLIGLSNVKKIVKEAEAMFREQIRNPKLKETGMYSSMIFCGNPGTCKTTVAGLLAKCLGEAGLTGGAFVSVSRRDLEGKFLGHTAPKVADAFKRARGGVLFVDEAGFMTQKGSGNVKSYTDEIIKEFVRYMELMPDVTVIFAMYEKEAEDFLALDSGLRSRISRIVRFADYTDEECEQIAGYMYGKRGYKMQKGCMKLITEYLNKIRSNEDFGNARDVRKIVEHSIRAHSMNKQDDPDMITLKDVKDAIMTLMSDAKENAKKARRIGFDPGRSDMGQNDQMSMAY